MNWNTIPIRFNRWRADRQLRFQIDRVEGYLGGTPGDRGESKSPVMIFNASTRISHLSLNGAFNLLAAWALRAAGIPVKHVVCERGMLQCLLGTRWEDKQAPPPCGTCIRFSRDLYPEEHIISLRYKPSWEGGDEWMGAGDLSEMAKWSYRDYSLGELCLPSLQWALRRKDIPDTDLNRSLYLQYLRSAAYLVDRFEALNQEHRPRAWVVFNGITYPEAVAKSVAAKHSIPVITHEVGLRPQSAFFSHQEATFRELEMPEGFALDEGQEGVLDAYLEDRMQGRFSMAGVRFWPAMESFPARLEKALEAHQQMVVIFTNVIFDTSQVHANTLFEDMFDWLDSLVPVIVDHPETLFVLRAHPDENRPGKASRQSVQSWYQEGGLMELPNLIFIPPSEYISSYDLIGSSKFCLVYNSSIGLEASILGAPVLCAGKARYTQIKTVFYPDSPEAYHDQLVEFLQVEAIPVPAEFVVNARRFLYFELHHASLDLSPFLESYPAAPGFVTFKDFEPERLRGDRTRELQVIVSGILDGRPFVLPEAG